MTDPTPSDADLRPSRWLARVAVMSWIAAATAFQLVLTTFPAAFVPVFASLEVELPGSFVFFTDLGGWMKSPQGLTAVNVLLGASVLPFLLGTRNRRMAKRYAKAAVVMIVITVLAYLMTWMPGNKLQQKLGEDSPAEYGSPR